MKGVVFTEFLELVEEKFGYETVDKIVTEACPETNGAYTSVGTYDHGDLLNLVVALSKEVNVPIADLVNVFGKHLFCTFAKGYFKKLGGFSSSFDLLEKIQGFIHVEVRKIYPDAELPHFDYERPGEDELVLIYQSKRPFADLCEGLIQQCVTHFNENIDISRENLSDDGTHARFTLLRHAEVAVSS